MSEYKDTQHTVSGARGVVQRSRLRSIILSLTTLGLIVAFIYYLYLNADKYIELIHVSPSAVILLMAITLISVLVNGAINTYLFQGLGTKLSFRDGFLLAAASTLTNQLPISGGMITRGIYLKHKFNLSYTIFLSASLALFVCFVSVNGFIGTVILLYWRLFRKISVTPFLLIGFALMMACLLVFWLPFDRITFSDRLRKRLFQALEGWLAISSSYVLVVKLVGLQTILMILLAFRYWLAFHMLSQNVSIGEVVLFSSASVLTQLVSIAPGGLGVTEAIVAAVASALGFDLGVSVVAVGLDRLVSTSVILLVGGISTIILGRQISKLPMKSK